MGVTIGSKNYSIDMGYVGFNDLRQKVADLTAEDIAHHYRDLQNGIFLMGEAHKKFFEEYNRKITELDKKHNGKFNYVLHFLYASDCDGEMPWEVCEKIHEVIKDYDDNVLYGYCGRPDCAKFRDFKEIVKDCVDNKCSMTWY